MNHLAHAFLAPDSPEARVGSRIRFANQFAGIIEEIRENDEQLEARFLQFFPELLNFATKKAVSLSEQP